MDYKFLNGINSPEDLKALDEADMPRLADEIREFIIEAVKKNGGHLASNLGTVELTLALHRVFNSPHDHIIFDVGHQSYTHKIITGRRADFDTLRRPGGMSGFTKRSESAHDPFGAGHSSTSLSAALGFARADKLSGSDAYTIAVIGDGAYTGGMIHEAFNNCAKKMRLIIIINENEMSISKNIGGFARQMAKIRSRKSYYKAKDAARSVLNGIPLVGRAMSSVVSDTKQSLKNAMYDSNYFEDMGLYYIGPVNGNDYGAIEELLQVAKRLDQSCVIHVFTKKGKGYRPAETMPDRYHSVPPLHRHPASAQGANKPLHAEKPNNFSNAAGNYLCSLAEKNKKICAVTAAMTNGTGLDDFSRKHPSRFFDVGIAEEHAATFCAGLAAGGMLPVFAVYSSFLQRAYDNLIHDIAIQDLPVVLLVDRAGLSSGDGATHHGIFDVSFLSQIPGMTIYAPATFDALRRAMDDAIKRHAPCAIRYSNDTEHHEIIELYASSDVVCDLLCADVSNGDETVIVTYGKITLEAIKARKRIPNCGLILLERLKPYENIADMLEELVPASVKRIIFLEEGIKNGGASMILHSLLCGRKSLAGVDIRILAIDDDFVFGEEGKKLLQSAHISADDVVKAALEN